MRKALAVAGIALLGGLTAVGCQSHPTHVKVSPAQQRQLKQAEKIVTACVTGHAGNFKATAKCIVPGGGVARIRFETCTAHTLPLLANKAKFEGALEQCVIKDR